MLKRLFLLLIVLLVPTQARAFTTYFSDCATGGAGTEANPYCLNPQTTKPGGGTYTYNVSAQIMFDGIGTAGTAAEAAAGDTIVFCCGGSDGCGDATTTCTFNPACTGTVSGGSAWIRPDLNPGASRITFTAYPGDRPTITGDSNSNDSYNGTHGACTPGTDEPEAMFAHAQAYQGFNFIGLDFVKWSRAVIHLDEYGSGGITVDRCNVSYVGDAGWGVTTGVGSNATCADGTQGANMDGVYAFYLWGLKFPFVFQNGTIHTVCGMIFRNIVGDHNNSSGAPQIHDYKVLNSTIGDAYQISNDWGTWDYKLGVGGRIEYSGNYFYDFRFGIGFEDRNWAGKITDNTFACTGDLDTSSNAPSPITGKSACHYAIRISGGDYGECRNGTNGGHLIARNKFWGKRASGDSSSADGWLEAGIIWADSVRNKTQCSAIHAPWFCCIDSGTGWCNTSGAPAAYTGACDGNGGSEAVNIWGPPLNPVPPNLIENNLFWNINSVVFPSKVGTPTAAIGISTNATVSARNNTIYSSKNPIVLSSGDASQAGSFSFDGNIVSEWTGGRANIVYESTASSPGFNNNNLYDVTGAARIISLCTSYDEGNGDCNTYGSDVTCGDVATWDPPGGGDNSNICTAPQFLNTAGGVDTWDLHIKATGPDFNAATSGPQDDVDHDPRPMPQFGTIANRWDRGADEVRISGLAAPYGSWTYSAGAECDATDGSNGTVTVTYGNYAPTTDQHNVIMHWYSDVAVPLSITKISDTCNCTGSDCDLGDIATSVETSCTITFECGHTPPSAEPKRKPVKVFFWFQSDEYIPEDPRAPAADDGTLPTTPVWPTQLFWIQR